MGMKWKNKLKEDKGRELQAFFSFVSYTYPSLPR